MFQNFSYSALGLAVAALLVTTSGTFARQPLQLVPAFPNLIFDDNASTATVTPDEARRVVVGFQRGQIRVLPKDKESSEAPLFLDLREKMRTETGFEDGLHGVAFHPRFATERRVFVCYSQSAPRRTVLSEFQVAAGAPFQADAASEKVLMEVLHPLGNHWGGGIAFGPDGFLYVGIGDGGLRDDPYRLSQNLWTLHGKILRIDVNRTSPGLAYGIPSDNPFVKLDEIRDEIWAYGFRNPWGMSFDFATGTLWCGDVGQDRWEEVNLVKAGGNYGWSEQEGAARFETRKESAVENGPFVDPIHCYPRPEGNSITGGFVYRGRSLPALAGTYLFGDWGTGRIWSLRWNPKTGSAGAVSELYAASPEGPRFNPTVIAADDRGEPLCFSHSPAIAYTLQAPLLLAEAEEAAVDDAPPVEVVPSVEGNPEDASS
jgi:glucose/arabinose dehydrogenase